MEMRRRRMYVGMSLILLALAGCSELSDMFKDTKCRGDPGVENCTCHPQLRKMDVCDGGQCFECLRESPTCAEWRWAECENQAGTVVEEIENTTDGSIITCKCTGVAGFFQ